MDDHDDNILNMILQLIKKYSIRIRQYSCSCTANRSILPGRPYCTRSFLWCRVFLPAFVFFPATMPYTALPSLVFPEFPTCWAWCTMFFSCLNLNLPRNFVPLEKPDQCVLSEAKAISVHAIDDVGDGIAIGRQNRPVLAIPPFPRAIVDEDGLDVSGDVGDLKSSSGEYLVLVVGHWFQNGSFAAVAQPYHKEGEGHFHLNINLNV